MAYCHQSTSKHKYVPHPYGKLQTGIILFIPLSYPLLICMAACKVIKTVGIKALQIFPFDTDKQDLDLNKGQFDQMGTQ